MAHRQCIFAQMALLLMKNAAFSAESTFYLGKIGIYPGQCVFMAFMNTMWIVAMESHCRVMLEYQSGMGEKQVPDPCSDMKLDLGPVPFPQPISSYVEKLCIPIQGSINECQDKKNTIISFTHFYVPFLPGGDSK